MRKAKVLLQVLSQLAYLLTLPRMKIFPDALLFFFSPRFPLSSLLLEPSNEGREGLFSPGTATGDRDGLLSALFSLPREFFLEPFGRSDLELPFDGRGARVGEFEDAGKLTGDFDGWKLFGVGGPVIGAFVERGLLVGSRVGGLVFGDVVGGGERGGISVGESVTIDFVGDIVDCTGVGGSVVGNFVGCNDVGIGVGGSVTGDFVGGETVGSGARLGDGEGATVAGDLVGERLCNFGVGEKVTGDLDGGRLVGTGVIGVCVGCDVAALHARSFRPSKYIRTLAVSGDPASMEHTSTIRLLVVSCHAIARNLSPTLSFASNQL